MFYFLYGTDTKKSREKLHELLATLQKKKPDASVFRVEADSFSTAVFDEFIAGQGLFEQKYIVVCDKVCESAEAKEYLKERGAELSASDNVFLVLEEKPDASFIKKMEAAATKVQEFEKKAGPVSRAFDLFSLSNAYAARDRKTLFTRYTQAVLQGISPEEIHGILLWQVKAMLIAAQSESAVAAGQKLFVYQKAKSAMQHFSPTDAQQHLRSLVFMYHDMRRGIVTMENALEQFILRV